MIPCFDCRYLYAVTESCVFGAFPERFEKLVKEKYGHTVDSMDEKVQRVIMRPTAEANSFLWQMARELQRICVEKDSKIQKEREKQTQVLFETDTCGAITVIAVTSRSTSPHCSVR